MKDQVDILLATYQGGRFLDEQLASLIEQTYSPIRILIRDDGSNDQTPTIIQKWRADYPDRIQVLPTTERLGVKGNFSTLMESCTAPYVMFSDQDDHWLPDKVEKSLALIKKMEKVYGSDIPLAVHTDLKVVGQDLNELSSSFWKYSRLNPTIASFNRLLAQNVVTGCTLLINRPLLKLAAPVPKEAVMHDWWIAMAASCFGYIESLNESTMLYRQHENNDTGAQPYRLGFHLKNFSKLAKRPNGTYSQAAQFLSRYQKLLAEDKRQMLKTYCELANASFFKKLSSVVHHQFYKQGLLRNLKMLFYG